MAECILCGENVSPESDLLFKKNGYPISRCPTCDMVQVVPRPPPEECYRPFNNEHEKYLENNYQFVKSVAKKGGYPTGGTDLKRMKERIGEIESIFPSVKNGPVIEVGCYAGSFLRLVIEQWKCKAAGIELDKKYAELAKKQFNLEIIEKKIEEIEGTENLYTLAVMFEVIEHLIEPLLVLKKLNKMVKMSGVLAISTPNFNSEAVEYFGKDFSHFTPPNHLNYYSNITLCKIMSQAGFLPVYIRTEREPLNWPLKLATLRSIAPDRTIPNDNKKQGHRFQNILANTISKIGFGKFGVLERKVKNFPDNILTRFRDQLDFRKEIPANRKLKGSYLVVYGLKISHLN